MDLARAVAVFFCVVLMVSPAMVERCRSPGARVSPIWVALYLSTLERVWRAAVMLDLERGGRSPLVVRAGRSPSRVATRLVVKLATWASQSVRAVVAMARQFLFRLARQHQAVAEARTSPEAADHAGVRLRGRLGPAALVLEGR